MIITKPCKFFCITGISQYLLYRTILLSLFLTHFGPLFDAKAANLLQNKTFIYNNSIFIINGSLISVISDNKKIKIQIVSRSGKNSTVKYTNTSNVPQVIGRIKLFFQDYFEIKTEKITVYPYEISFNALFLPNENTISFTYPIVYSGIFENNTKMSVSIRKIRYLDPNVTGKIIAYSGSYVFNWSDEIFKYFQKNLIEKRKVNSKFTSRDINNVQLTILPGEYFIYAISQINLPNQSCLDSQKYINKNLVTHQVSTAGEIEYTLEKIVKKSSLDVLNYDSCKK